MQGIRNDTHDEIYIPNQDQFINEVMNRVMQETNLPDVLGRQGDYGNMNQVPRHGRRDPSSMQMSNVSPSPPLFTNSTQNLGIVTDGFNNSKR